MRSSYSLRSDQEIKSVPKLWGKVIVAVAILSVSMPSLSNAQESNPPPYTNREILQIASENMCRQFVSEPAKQKALNHFKLSPITYCGCVVPETVYAMEGSQYLYEFLSYIVRSVKSGSTKPTSSEQLGIEDFRRKMDNSMANCSRRLTGY